MQFKVLGVKTSSGEFTPPGSNNVITYDNRYLNGYWLDQKKYYTGYETDRIKLSATQYNELVLPLQNSGGILNHIVDIQYNKDGNIEIIKIVK